MLTCNDLLPNIVAHKLYLHIFKYHSIFCLCCLFIDFETLWIRYYCPNYKLLRLWTQRHHDERNKQNAICKHRVVYRFYYFNKNVMSMQITCFEVDSIVLIASNILFVYDLECYHILVRWMSTPGTAHYFQLTSWKQPESGGGHYFRIKPQRQ